MTTTDREGQQPGIGAQLGGHLRENGMVLALLATIYPSLRAAAVRPAEALRYE